ncbi:MAG TPA: oxalate/formate MFS antiporter, partial [Blastocatellia bacterium]|nr:oxalate/formate MFS antiporter [Blastocatellia bacterium]
IASILIAAGWIGAGLAASLPVLYVSYAIGGVGTGAVYGACIGLALKWFPDRRGLCVGVVAGSYGFGTALTAIPISNMIETSGYAAAFIVWGVVQGVAVLAAAQFLSMPPGGWAPADRRPTKTQTRVQQSDRNYTPREMVRTPSFYALYLMMTIVAFSGLMITAQLRPIATTYGANTYIVFGSLTALNLALTLDRVMNGLARPFFGWVSDHLGRYDTMALAFGLGGVTIAALAMLVHRPLAFALLTGLSFFAWGEIYSLFPSAIADVYGSKYATTNYGIQYTSKGLASLLAAPAASWVQESTGSWLPVLWAAVAFNLIAAALAVVWLKPMVRRLLAAQQNVEPTNTPTNENQPHAAACLYPNK